MERSGLEWENLGIPRVEKQRIVDLSMHSSNSSSRHGNGGSSGDEFGKLGYNLHSSYYDVVMREPLTGLRLGRQKEYGGAGVVSSLPFSAGVPVAKRSRASYQNMQNPCCQVEGCNLDLKLAKDYHRRHRICESHSKSPKVVVAGMERRFCQQCSRFHELSEFDDKKRSCRRRLSDHNARRRRVQPESVAVAHRPLVSPGIQASAVYDEGSQNVLLSGLPVSLSNSSWENVNGCMLRQGRDSTNEVHIARAVLDQGTRTSNATAAGIPPEDVISAQSLLSSNNSWSMNEGESASSMEGLMNNNINNLSLLESNNINPMPASGAAGGEPVSVPLVHSINLQDSDNSHLQEFHLFYDPPRFYSTPRNLL